LIDLLRTWWPLLLLVYVPTLVAKVTRVVFTRSLRRLDKSHADDLPLTAGEWLATELERLGLHRRVRTMVTDQDAKLSIDGYHPFQGVIQLSAETHFKRDPMHWAIAAHELGHARFHLSWPVLGRVMIAMLYVKHVAISLAVALVIGNVAFALPHVTNLALLLFVLGVVLHLFVLLDEIVASVLAMQSLRASPMFAWSHMRSARRLLTIAFSTYLVGFLARTLLLTQWPLVEQLTRDALVPPVMTLTTLGLVLAALLSVVLVISLLAAILVRVVKPPDWLLAINGGVTMLANLATFLLLLLVWNVGTSAHHAYWVMLAVIPVQGLFVFPLMVPMTLLDNLVLDRFVKKWIVEITHRTSEFWRDHEAGSAQRKVGNVLIRDLLAKTQTSPPLERRVVQVLQLSFLPLLIAFWLS
jgi:Zn-dependent membrane protease YugP